MLVYCDDFVLKHADRSGDSVQYFRNLWKGKTAEDIYREMSEEGKSPEQKE